MNCMWLSLSPHFQLMIQLKAITHIIRNLRTRTNLIYYNRVTRNLIKVQFLVIYMISLIPIITEIISSRQIWKQNTLCDMLIIELRAKLFSILINNLCHISNCILNEILLALTCWSRKQTIIVDYLIFFENMDLDDEWVNYIHSQ